MYWINTVLSLTYSYHRFWFDDLVFVSGKHSGPVQQQNKKGKSGANQNKKNQKQQAVPKSER